MFKKNRTTLLAGISILLLSLLLMGAAGPGPQAAELLFPLDTLAQAQFIDDDDKACSAFAAGKLATVDGSTLNAYTCDGGNDYRLVIHEPRKLVKDGSDVYVVDYRGVSGNQHTITANIPVPDFVLTKKDFTNQWFDLEVPVANDKQVFFNENTDSSWAGLYTIPTGTNAGSGLTDWHTLVGITLEWADTASEAIDIMGYLIETYGLRGSAESFMVSDPNEVWVIEIPGNSKIWLAQRVPDNAVCFHANRLRLQEFDWDDADNYRYSKDEKGVATAVSNAATRRITDTAHPFYVSGQTEQAFYYEPDRDGAFNFERIYSSQSSRTSTGNFRREFIALTLLCPSVNWDHAGISYPVWVVPEIDVTAEWVMDVLWKNVYDIPEGYSKYYNGEYSLYEGYAAGPYKMADRASGAGTFERPIATQTQTYCTVGVARDWVPDELGLLWFSNNIARTGIFAPIYVSAKTLPASWWDLPGFADEQGEPIIFQWVYQPESTWWQFQHLKTLCNVRYKDMIAEVRNGYGSGASRIKGFNEIEADFREIQAMVETEALSKTGAARIDYLTDYTYGACESVDYVVREMIAHLITRYRNGSPASAVGPEWVALFQEDLPANRSTINYNNAGHYHTVKFDPGAGKFLLEDAKYAFDSQGSLLKKVAFFNIGVALPPEPYLAGYAFAGWYDGENEFKFYSAVSADITLTAKWENAHQAALTAYNKAHADFSAYYNTSNWTFLKHLLSDYTDASVAEAERIMGAAGQAHANLLAAYGKLAAGRFGENDDTDVIIRGTDLLNGGIADMLAILKLKVKSEDVIEAYNAAHAAYSAYYNTATWQFKADMFADYTYGSVMEAQRIMNAAGGAHAALLAQYGKLAAGRFDVSDNGDVIAEGTAILNGGVEGMLAVLQKTPEEDEEDKCSSIAVGKAATADGSTLNAYTCDGTNDFRLVVMPAGDWDPEVDEYVIDYVGVTGNTHSSRKSIPQVAHTYQWFRAEVPVANEHQVFFNENTCASWSGLSNRTSAECFMDWHTLVALALQRAATASEAVDVMGQLIDEYGLRGSAEDFTVSDPNEVWLFEIPGNSTVWVAQRIPDNAACYHANRLRLQEIDFDDPDNFRYSENLVSWPATKAITNTDHPYYVAGETHYYYEPERDGPFSFEKVYSTTARRERLYDARREFIAMTLLCPSIDWDDASISLPVYVVPEFKITPEWIMDVLWKNVYEIEEGYSEYYDGKYSMLNDWAAGPYGSPDRQSLSPGLTFERPIAVQTQTYCTVGVARDWVPDELGLLWYSNNVARTGIFVPIYVSARELPDAWSNIKGFTNEEGTNVAYTFNYDPASTWWQFQHLKTLCNFRYKDMIADVRSGYYTGTGANRVQVVKGFNEIEADFRTNQAAVEAAALELSGAARVDYLTNYTKDACDTATQAAKDMIAHLVFRFRNGSPSSTVAPKWQELFAQYNPATYTTINHDYKALGYFDVTFDPGLGAFDLDESYPNQWALKSSGVLPKRVASQNLGVAAPPQPLREGYTFAGWFDAAEGGTEYTTQTPVTGDITLYAQWAAPAKGQISVGFPGIQGATVQYYTNVSQWVTVGVFDGSAGFTIPPGHMPTWGVTTVRVIKDGMYHTFTLNSLDEPVVLQTPLATIKVIGVVSPCNLAIVQDNWVYPYTPALIGAANEFLVFDNGKKYEVRVQKPGEPIISIKGIGAGETVDLSK